MTNFDELLISWFGSVHESVVTFAAFGFMMFCGMYILSFLPEIPASDGEVRQMLIETGAAIVALGATNLIFLGMSLWRNRAA
jgi:hypothetical protein